MKALAYWFKSIPLVFVLLAGIVFATPLRQGQDPQEKPVLPEDYLPKGEARELMLQGCVQCHDLRNTVSQRKTAGRDKPIPDELKKKSVGNKR